ncbi:type II toxin-antitoxin system VapC family toxin [Bradyrhizobium sp. Pa8]|uniref:type II toxin-antitoxin system VapC family toxin n=1 Tax=Bradyrhizobium sp. Pa8 TaxID=3386552 RepID=UPI00403F40EA
MSGFDFDAALRWARFDPRKTLARRQDSDLSFVRGDRIGGQSLLLDTCVYIDQMQSRTPGFLEVLIANRQTNHSSVAIQELMHTIGVLDPQDGRSRTVLDAIRTLILSMPAHRTFVPDADVLGRAALLSGMICRLQSYAGDYRLRALLDCVLFLQALKLGFSVLTANVADFDILLQLLPEGKVLFYRRK